MQGSRWREKGRETLAPVNISAMPRKPLDCRRPEAATANFRFSRVNASLAALAKFAQGARVSADNFHLYILI